MRAAAREPGHTGPLRRPTPLGQLPPLLQRMVIIGEDSRFRAHHGIDPAEIGDALGLDHGRGLWGTLATAWGHRDQLRGASTITQQLAKNLYLSPSRNPLRKAKEAVTALCLELELPKDRILELYLNVVEWGPGIWGADAASRAYFGVAASHLTEEEAAALAATLPHPLTSNPAFRPDRMLARRDLILARYHGVEVSIPSEEEIPGPAPRAAPAAPADSLATAAPTPAPPAPDSLVAVGSEATPDTGPLGRDSLP